MSAPAPTLVLLAAGMGSRYGGLKQMEPLGPNGETLLDYSVFDAKRAGFGSVVFIIREDFAGEFKSRVASRFAAHIPVDYAYQRLDDVPGGYQRAPHPVKGLKPWGTGHATLAARTVVKGPFAVINADDYYGRDSYEVLARFLMQPDLERAACRSCMIGFQLDRTLSDHGTVARGVAQADASGLMVKVEELKDLKRAGTGVENRPKDGPVHALTGLEPVSLNMWGFLPSIFTGFERLFADFLARRSGDPDAEFYIPEALDQLIREGKEQCRILPTTSSWFGVTYKEDAPLVRASLAALHASGEYPARLWE